MRMRSNNFLDKDFFFGILMAFVFVGLICWWVVLKENNKQQLQAETEISEEQFEIIQTDHEEVKRQQTINNNEEVGTPTYLIEIEVRVNTLWNSRRRSIIVEVSKAYYDSVEVGDILDTFSFGVNDSVRISIENKEIK